MRGITNLTKGIQKTWVGVSRMQKARILVS